MRLASVLVAITMVGCAATVTEFKAYEGRGNATIEGKGGTKVTVDGMDVWDYGDPPRKFRVMGIIDDQRPGGIIPMNQLRGDIVRKARGVGGDAVIQLNNQSQIAGFYQTGYASGQAFGNVATASGFATAMPLRKNFARFAVIKYED
jgi:hypothetical protein